MTVVIKISKLITKVVLLKEEHVEKNRECKVTAQKLQEHLMNSL